MPDDFNPYREWLGFDDGREPADYYQLLGLSRDDGDPDLIAHKADVLTAKVRRVRPGGRLRQWQELLDTIQRAKNCLLDPAARSNYEVALRAGAAGLNPQPASAAPPAMPQMPSPAPSPFYAPPPPPPPPSGPLPGFSPPPMPTAAGPMGPPTPQTMPPSAPVGPMPAGTPPGWPAWQPAPLVGQYPQPGAPGFYPPQPPGYPVPGQLPPGAGQPPIPPFPQPNAPGPMMVPDQSGFWYAGYVPGQPLPEIPPPGYPAAPGYPQVPGVTYPHGAYPQQPGMPRMPAPMAPAPTPVPAPSPAPEQPAEWSQESFAAFTDTSPEWLKNPGAAIGDDPSTAPPAPAAGWGQEPPVAPSALPAPPSPPQAEYAAPAAVDAEIVRPNDAYRAAQQAAQAAAVAKAAAAQKVIYLLWILVIGLVVICGFLLWNKLRPTSAGPTEEPTLASADKTEGARGGDRAKTIDTTKPAENVKKTEPANPAKTQSAVAQPKPRPKPGPKATLDPNAGTAEDPPEEPSKTEAKPVPETKPPVEETGDPRKRAAMKQSLAAARKAMAGRDLPGARKSLAAAKADVQSEGDQAEFNRVQMLLDNLEEFWKGMSLVLSKMGPTQEFMLGNTHAIVVSADANFFSYRVAGQNYEYSLKDMPTNLVVTLAQAGFAKKGANNVLIGTFLAMDAGGDRKLALQYWQAAAQQGEDVSDLLPELGITGSIHTAKPPETPGAKPAALPAAPADAAKLRQADEAMRQKYQADFDQATRPPAKLALAQKLMSAARGGGLPAEDRFVMLNEAKVQAAAAGKAQAACEAIDAQAGYFAIDPIAEKLTALEGMLKGARSVVACTELSDAAIASAKQAVDAKRLDDAERFAKIAMASAKQSNNKPLMQKVFGALQRMGAAAKQPPPEEGESDQ